MKAKIKVPRNQQQKAHQTGMSMSLNKKLVGGRERWGGGQLGKMGRPPAPDSMEGVYKKQNKCRTYILVLRRCKCWPQPGHFISLDLTPSKSPWGTSEMHMESIPPAILITPKNKDIYIQESRKPFKPEHLGNCNTKMLAGSFAERRVTRLVCAGHCWVVAGHQKQKHLADTRRRGPDVERSQHKAGSSPLRGEQGGSRPLDNMLQSHPGTPPTAT